MRFGNPQILWLMALALPLLAWFLVAAWRRRQRLMTQFIQARLLPTLTVRLSPRREKTRATLLFIAVTLLFLSLARPQWGFRWEEARQRGLDIIVAIDTSRSMLAPDIAPNRLERAKLAALDLVRQARTDRLGLVAFAGTAFLQCPLTLDDQAFRLSLDALDTRIIPQGGTAIAAAIETAIAAFKDEDNFRVVILVSDGEDHDAQAVESAQKAAEAGIRIFTLGAGTPGGELLQIVNQAGQSEYIKDDAGNVVKSRLNEALLQQIATAANGFYLPLAAPQSIETLYKQGLAPLPKSEISSRLTRRYHERFQWPLALAIILLAIEAVLARSKRPRPTPSGNLPATNRSADALLLLALLPLLGVAQTSHASTASALKAYHDGHYESALEAYQQLAEQDPNDHRLAYNLGTAAYQANQLESAAQAFTNSLTAPDLQLQQKSFYNLGNTLFRLGESTTNLSQRAELWQQSTNSFSAALQLDPADENATNNLEYVRRRLEELQQNQQNQQDQSDQSEESEEQEQQDQDDQTEPQDQSEQQDESNQQDESEQQDSSQQQDQSEEQGQEEQDQSSQPEQPEPSDQQEQQDPSQEPGEGQPSPTAPGEMTPQQARQMLDAQQDNERTMIFLPVPTNVTTRPLLKDW